MAIIKEHTPSRTQGVLGKIRSYSEIVELLDDLVPQQYSQSSIKRMQELDKLFDYPSKKIDIILVGGTNSKSSTINFAAKLLREEGYKVGAAYSTHFLTYNERIVVDVQTIPNKKFTDITGEVINTAEFNKIKATASELMLVAALVYFKNEAVDVALIEVGLGGRLDATSALRPKICAVTRVAQDHTDILGEDLDAATKEMVGVAKKNTWFISAEQSKIRLQKMKEWAEERGAQWAMPIRKLAALPYVFEQLYGRSASLAERIVQIYVEKIKEKFSPFLRGNLLATQRGQRGRPTLAAKRQAELNPIKTLKSFWNEEFNLLRGRFELLDKEKPTILLDNAHNLDALGNVFLGVRLLHYQRPLDGFALIMGMQSHLDAAEIMKLVRYLFKKVSGQLYFVPLVKGKTTKYHEPEALEKLAKELNIKGKACSTFAEAFDAAKAVVDERHGLVTITGCPSLITEYWKMRGIKKFN